MEFCIRLHIEDWDLIDQSSRQMFICLYNNICMATLHRNSILNTESFYSDCAYMDLTAQVLTIECYIFILLPHTCFLAAKTVKNFLISLFQSSICVSVDLYTCV